MITHFGGWLMLRMWQTSREQRFQCSGCNEFFHARTKNSPLARVVLLLFALMILYAIYDWLAVK